jgi:hypothetical protein
MRAKVDTEKIQKSETSETFANNKPEEVEECQICHQTEECGIYLTRQMAREQQETGKEVEILSGMKSRKRKLKTDSCEGSGLVCKASKMQTQMRDRDILSIGSKITDLAHQKEMMALAQSKQADLGKNRESNLFDPKREYLMGSSPLEQNI